MSTYDPAISLFWYTLEELCGSCLKDKGESFYKLFVNNIVYNNKKVEIIQIHIKKNK